MVAKVPQKRKELCHLLQLQETQHRLADVESSQLRWLISAREREKGGAGEGGEGGGAGRREKKRERERERERERGREGKGEIGDRWRMKWL